jgi:hypothetical protein
VRPPQRLHCLLLLLLLQCLLLLPLALPLQLLQLCLLPILATMGATAATLEKVAFATKLRMVVMAGAAAVMSRSSVSQAVRWKKVGTPLLAPTETVRILNAMLSKGVYGSRSTQVLLPT